MPLLTTLMQFARPTSTAASSPYSRARKSKLNGCFVDRSAIINGWRAIVVALATSMNGGTHADDLGRANARPSRPRRRAKLRVND